MSDLAVCVATSGLAADAQRQAYPWVARADAEGVIVRTWDVPPDWAGAWRDERVALPGAGPAAPLAGCGRWLLLGAGPRLFCWDAGPVRGPPEALGRLPGRVTALCASGDSELLAGDDRGSVRYYTRCDGRWWASWALDLTAPIRALADWDWGWQVRGGRPGALRDVQGRRVGSLALCTADELLFVNETVPSITHRFPAQDPALLAWCGARACVGGAHGLQVLDPATGWVDTLLDGWRRRPTALAYDAKRQRIVAAAQVFNPGLVPTGCELWTWDASLAPVRHVELPLSRFAHIVHIGWWQDEPLLVDQQGGVHRAPG